MTVMMEINGNLHLIRAVLLTKISLNKRVIVALGSLGGASNFGNCSVRGPAGV